MKNLCIIFLTLFWGSRLMAQTGMAMKSGMVMGTIIEETEKGKTTPIVGAVVGVKGTTNAVVSDDKGGFMLENVHPKTDTLITSSLGYYTDTTALKGNTMLTITLYPLSLKAVEVNARKATRITLSPMNVEVINSSDLVKDACCNLSESFENSASVDASYSDAVSGAKEIRMLGLAGIYTQIMVENIPSIRGLGSTFGLNYVPGPLMESIQVNKGAGSVTNGYEAVTGQINIEYKKPLTADKLYVNLYLNQDLRTELNVITAHRLQKGWSMLSSVQGSANWLRLDMNKDHYLDNPMVKNLNVFQRFEHHSSKGFGFWTGVTVNLDDRIGGNTGFNPKESVWAQNQWGLRLQTQRVEAFAKTGWSFADHSSVGVQYKYIFHHQQGYVGRRNYSGMEHFGYLNAIYQREIDDHGNLIKIGSSFLADNVTEAFDTFNRKRLELVPGVFGETALKFGQDDKVVVVGGMRFDYHSLYGPFASPRLNIKWNILYGLSLRLSAGRGYRVPTIFAENYGLLANNRTISIDPDIKYEEAWNYGASLTYTFNLNFHEAVISVDYYRTDFIHQMVVDIENPRLLQFYDLKGKSFANALQAEVSYEPVKRFDVKIAYKYEHTKTDYVEGRKLYPLRPQHRGLISLGYTTRNDHWRFNTSLNWFGKTRIPDTSENDAANQRSTQSPNWVQLNAQITFKWKRWEVYTGGENLVNFVQKNPIIAGDAPFSNQFDASMIWGPLRGAMIFAGVRFMLK